MEYVLPPLEVALRLGMAAFCGLVIGLDREIKHKNVGVRTFLLVCLGSAAFSVIIIEISNIYLSQYEEVGIDPTRIVQGIVTGIGFLGGGAILQTKKHVSGAATGASIWIAGAIGVACGYGFYWHAAIVTFYAFVVLAVVGQVRATWRSDIDSDKGNTSNKGEQED